MPRLSISQRRVGLELRRLRAETGRTLDDVAGEMEWSASKLSRIENGESRVLARDVRLLCELLGADDDLTEALGELVKTAKAKGWWERYRDILRTNYIPFETQAAEVNEFQLEVVPGLLQTPAYIRAIQRAARTEASDEEIERRVQVRLDRQAALDRAERPLRLWAVLSEGALLRQVGGPRVLREQLAHLAKRSERPNVDIQILPFDAGAHASLGSTFSIFRFADAEPVVFGNRLNSIMEVEDPEDIRQSLACFDWLRAAAESPERSRRIIADAANAAG